jgi:uroporphyrinogen-III synthase
VNLPLKECRIVVTRAAEQAGDLQERLEALGAHVLLFPTVAISAIEPPPSCNPASFDWVIFTSTNAVRFFFETLGTLPQPEGVLAAAVGAATADALAARGWQADVVPDEYVAEALVDSLLAAEPKMDGKRFLLPRGNLNRDIVSTALRQRGAEVEELVVYQNICPEASPQALTALEAFGPHLVAFTSPSTAVNFSALLGEAGVSRLKEGCRFAAIGPVTTQAAEKCGMPIAIEPRTHTLRGLVDAIVQKLPAKGNGA